MLKKSFKIDDNIYELSFLEEAINSFNEIAAVIYDNWLIEIEWETEEEINIIFWELMNYSLWLQIENL